MTAPHFPLSPARSLRSLAALMIAPASPEKSRLVVLLAVVLWISAIAAIVVGMRFRARPILLVGGLDAVLALFVTIIAASSRRSR